MSLLSKLLGKAKKEISWRNIERFVKREKKAFAKEYDLTGDSTIEEVIAAVLDKALLVEQKLKAYEGKVKWLESQLPKNET